MDLILASTSPIRQELLRNAGVSFSAEAPNVDERAIEARHSGSDSELALALAEAKALGVSKGHPGATVIGSDSLISVEGRRFSKPKDREAAAEHLRYFSGRTMELTSAVAIASGSFVEWRQVCRARLRCRRLGESFIQQYLSAEWPEVGYCVGVFRLEGRGVQLFDAIEGDHFTILGLPLLPLLGALRDRGVLAA